MNHRKERGKAISQRQGQITRINQTHYKVRSQSRNKEHNIMALESGWSCSCEDHYFKKICCKHIHAVELSLHIRKQVRKQITVNEITVDSCPVCNSDNLRKDGIRHNKNHDIQRFGCKDCDKKFSVNLGFENMKASPEMITSAMQLYFTGESLRGVQKFLRLQGANFSHVAIYTS